MLGFGSFLWPWWTHSCCCSGGWCRSRLSPDELLRHCQNCSATPVTVVASPGTKAFGFSSWPAVGNSLSRGPERVLHRRRLGSPCASTSPISEAWFHQRWSFEPSRYTWTIVLLPVPIWPLHWEELEDFEDSLPGCRKRCYSNPQPSYSRAWELSHKWCSMTRDCSCRRSRIIAMLSRHLVTPNSQSHRALCVRRFLPPIEDYRSPAAVGN